MKRFIGKKVIKVPRYKLIYILTFFSICLIILFNIIFTLFLRNVNLDTNKLNTTKYLYGLNSKNNIRSIFERNLYGYKLIKDKPVIENKTNFKDLVIDSEPLIYLYNTFQTDKYKNNYYNSYNINSFVTQASKILSEYLKNYNINSIVEDKSVAKTLKENNIPYVIPSVINVPINYRCNILKNAETEEYSYYTIKMT